jgi:HSP20 family protein
MAKELTPWKPSKQLDTWDFDRMRRQMDRIWDSFFEWRPRVRAEEEGEWLPALDLTETPSDIVVKAEVPGLDSKDVDISLSDRILTIKGEKKQEREQKEENYHLVERSYGSFARSIHLPADVNSEKISASYKNGVLKIVLPKSEQARKKEVKIKVQ